MKFILSNNEEFFLMFNVDIDEISQDTGLEELSEALHNVADLLLTDPEDMGTVEEFQKEIEQVDNTYNDIMTNLMSK